MVSPVRGLHQAAYLLAALTLASQALALLRDRLFAQLLALTHQPAHLQQRYGHQQRQHADAEHLGSHRLHPLAHVIGLGLIRSFKHNSPGGANAGKHGPPADHKMAGR